MGDSIGTTLNLDIEEVELCSSDFNEVETTGTNGLAGFSVVSNGSVRDD